MNYLSFCSGIEAASVAWHRLGWNPVGFAEIEKFPSQVLAARFPTVPNFGDMTKFKEWNLNGKTVELLVGGTPCQSFSVAGLRRGLDDDRGNLSLVFCQAADYFDPDFVLWENVPGVLSDKGNAFGCFLAGLCGEDEALVPNGKWANAGVVSGPKRTIAWRVLDAQHVRVGTHPYAVPQRRRRIFVLAVRGSGNWAGASALFSFTNGMYGDSQKSRGQRKKTSPYASSGLDVSCAGTITAGFGKLGAPEVDAYTAIPIACAEITSSLCAADGPKGVSDQYAHEGKLIAMAHGQAGAEIALERSPTLTCVHEAPIVAFPTEMSGTQQATSENLSPCLSVGHTTAVSYGIPGNWIGRKPENGGNAVEPMVEVSPCQTKTDRHGVAYGIQSTIIGRNDGEENLLCFEPRSPDGHARIIDGNIAPTLNTMRGGQREPCVTYPINTMTCQGRPSDDLNPRMGLGIVEPNDPCPTLTKAHSHAVAVSSCDVADTLSVGANQTTGFASDICSINMQVRRLTPVECERLQGFPDGWTDIQLNGKPTPDGPRYKALGNSMAVNVMTWIGERIQMVVDSRKEVA